MGDIFTALGLGVVLFIFGLATYVSRAWRWRKAARRLGLETFGMGLRGRPGIRGRYRGVQVQVTTAWRWRSEYMVYEAKLPYASPPGLRMIHEGACPSTGGVLDDRRHKVGLPQIDTTFVVETLRPDAADAFFRRPAAADTLATLQRSLGNLRIEDGSIFIERRRFDSTDAIEATLYTLVDVLQKLAPAQPASSQAW